MRKTYAVSWAMQWTHLPILVTSFSWRLTTSAVSSSKVDMTTTEYYYVPLDQSLVSDAPGYGDAPVCWKCSNKTERRHCCKICHGKGRLPKRQVPDRPGKVTRGRISRQDMNSEPPHLPVGYSVPGYGPIVQKCTENCEDYCGTLTNEDGDDVVPPIWWPQTNEELCNLTGDGWRILQRVQSHRWTTDDLVTAAVAVRWCSNSSSQPKMRYLDLGCGNGSVLQMVLSKKSQQIRTAIGVEARSEAVSLARRSLAFNLGTTSSHLGFEIVHEDFRGFQSQDLFDLITGTPPYFAVGRKGEANQGGMPSAMQSAPARCEFRGGFEAYCEAASRLLAENGTFVVCENYLNHENFRTVQAFQACGWWVCETLVVRGKVNRTPLFVVYAAKRQALKSAENPVLRKELSVRNESGEWTENYKEQILQFMSAL